MSGSFVGLFQADTWSLDYTAYMWIGKICWASSSLLSMDVMVATADIISGFRVLMFRVFISRLRSAHSAAIQVKKREVVVRGFLVNCSACGQGLSRNKVMSQYKKCSAIVI